MSEALQEAKVQDVGSAVVTPPQLDRFEAKYIIAREMIDSIIAFARPYCLRDKYSAMSSDKYYTVNSLYLDTPGFLFLRNRMCKAEKRFNMRIRSYTDTPALPYFLEIKQRIGDVVRKRRAKVDNPDFAEHLSAALATPVYCGDSKNRSNTALFYSTAHRYNARPVVLMQYRRQAFFSAYDEYARITFDIDLRCMAQEGYDPIPLEQMMDPCDILPNSDCIDYAVLELKCYTSFVPLWMVDLVRAFNLQRTSISKYSVSLRKIFSHNPLEVNFNRNSALYHMFRNEE